MARRTGWLWRPLTGLLMLCVMQLGICALAVAAPARPYAAAAEPWDGPTLRDPTTITISNASRNLRLDQTKDYILECPARPVRLSWPLVVWGGRDVAFQNCDIDVTISNWAAAFKNQARELWVHDVHFGGKHLTGGIQLQEPGATVVMRDVLFDRVHGSYTTNHAECLQSWAGPARLLIDGLTCPTVYQGLFLLPNQFGNGPAPRIFDLRHVDIDDSDGAVALWLGDVKGGLAAMRVNLQDIYVVPNPARRWRGWWLWPSAGVWDGVRAGTPPGGHYVRPARNGATGVDEGVSLGRAARARA